MIECGSVYSSIRESIKLQYRIESARAMGERFRVRSENVLSARIVGVITCRSFCVKFDRFDGRAAPGTALSPSVAPPPARGGPGAERPIELHARLALA
jgi:hypothetical protein